MTEETASNETSAACKAASTNDVIDVAVIGAGPAGLTAGLYAARAGLNVVLFERISPGGQLAQTEHMENYPGFPEGTGGFELAFAMKQQADRFGASNVGEEVVSVDFTQNPKVLTTAFNEYRAKSVIIATGARPRKLGLELEEDLQGRGVSYCATCDGNFFRDKEVMVVGGGNTAAGDGHLSVAHLQESVPRAPARQAARHGHLPQAPGGPCRTSSSCGTPCPASSWPTRASWPASRLEMLGDGRGARHRRWTACSWPLAPSPTPSFWAARCSATKRDTSWPMSRARPRCPACSPRATCARSSCTRSVTAVSDGAVCAEEAAEYLAI